jgi:hypothetical protein
VAGAVTLGLIAAPDIPEKVARELAPELPDLLAKHVDGSVSWEVPVVVDPLTGTDREAPEILDVCRERMFSEGWDFALCLTDLPVYRSGTLVAADVSAKRGMAGLSLPAFKGAIAAAFATGAYVLAINSFWLLAGAMGFWRLLALM